MVWLVEGDRRHPQLIPYAEAQGAPATPQNSVAKGVAPQDQIEERRVRAALVYQVMAWFCDR
jgi:hypothetical protein